MSENEMVKKKSWEEFQKTGLILIINQILHIFGWAIVYEQDEHSKVITDVYPARVKFRGFGEKSVDTAYKKLSAYMKENASELDKEVNE